MSKRTQQPTRTQGSLARRAKDIHKRLARAMPEPRCELDHQGPWQLLIATILSAQSTDKTVNSVTPALFARYPTPAALAAARPEDVEALIKPTGFFRNKTKSIQGASRVLVEEHGGEVPRSMEALVRLPGVARKTANLVLGTAFGVPSGIVVDTHAGRVARRLGLTTESDPVKVERDLCALFAKKTWVATSHQLVLHGRYVCTSKAPDCPHCPLNELCPSADGEPEGRWTARADAERRRIEARGEPGTVRPHDAR